jgi:hypothetical protein
MVHDTVSGRRRIGGGDAMKRDVLTSPAERIEELRRHDEPDLRELDEEFLGLLEPEEEPRQAKAEGAMRRRLDRRTRAILAAAGIAAVVVNAGAAWSYWSITSPQSPATSTVELTLRARSDYNKQLMPGQAGNLTVALANDQDFPISISEVVREDQVAIADEMHRDGGCESSGVALTQNSFKVDWSVPKNTIGAFTIPDGLRMAADSPAACRGATFTLSIRIVGARRTHG